MTRGFKRGMSRSVALLIASVSLALAGCGGGGNPSTGGGGQAPPTPPSVTGVSYLGFSPAPSGNANAGVPLPGVYTDQALEVTFSANIDSTIFGGFYASGGTPVEFQGIAPITGTTVPYFAFRNQWAGQFPPAVTIPNCRSSLQIWENNGNQIQFLNYVVGRHRDKPNTLVIDPVIDGSKAAIFNLLPSTGFAAVTEYAFLLPSSSGITSAGTAAATFGPATVFALPIVTTTFTTQPTVPFVFATAATTSPNPTPPIVVSIAPVQHAGTIADPLANTGFGAGGTGPEPIRITFSQVVQTSTVDLLVNMVVRNTNNVTAQQPQGVLIPGSLTPENPAVGTSDAQSFLFAPSPTYGPGVNLTTGYDVQVRVGFVAVNKQIRGLPSANAPAGLPLNNTLSATFRTAPCPTCLGVSSVIESFEVATGVGATKDSTFAVPFTQAQWNSTALPGALAGVDISGTPYATSTLALGTRVQVIVAPNPEGTVGAAGPLGLFSPFDASLASSNNACTGTCGGACNLGACINGLANSYNPNGGSHIQHLYEFQDLGSLKRALELIEWAPVGQVTTSTTYPSYSIWAGLTNAVAPLNSACAAACGLGAAFLSNYLLEPYQTSIPPAETITAQCAGTVVGFTPKRVKVGGPLSYQTGAQFTQFVAFPLLSPPFDYANSAGQASNSVNLVFEQNIEPGTQAPNFNRYRSSAGTNGQLRRIVARPISLATAAGQTCPINDAAGYDVYRSRFTFVSRVSSARSIWYDTGQSNPTYSAFLLNPQANQQPAGTTSVWQLEGTDVLNPTPTSTVQGNGVVVNAAGVLNNNVLTQQGPSLGIATLRYFRFKVEMTDNTVTNAIPLYNSFVMAYTF